MKLKLLALAVFLLAIATSPVSAQIVADGATNTLSNVTNTITGDVTIGTNGSFTLLVLSNNALLTNSLNGVIGRNATARSNEVRLPSPTAHWLMGGDLMVGSNGSFNRLVVSNGARVDNFHGTLAAQPASSNNEALVTGPGSVWTNRGQLAVFASGNQLTVSNGAVVASGTGAMGGSSNRVIAITCRVRISMRNQLLLWPQKVKV